MTDSAFDFSDFHNLSDAERVDVVCDVFETRWQDGDPPLIENFLDQIPDDQWSLFAKELISIDVAYRRQHGETPQLADYSTWFPEEIDVLSSIFANQVDPETVNPSLSPHADTVSMQRQNSAEDSTYVPETTPAQSSPADQRFGDYELLEEIARGGMGVVYKARQTKLNRTVALKMILSGQLAGAEEVKRFYAEAEAAAKLHHPGIVPIYEVGELNGQHFFSMTFVEGQSLAQLVMDGGPLPPREAAELVRQIAEAAAFAHEKGIIHRDLKPANVLLDSNGQPKVTDFGLAKQTEGDAGLTGTGQILGTPSYMPPEQAAGKTADIAPHSDVYSLGAILYYLLTGRPPFQSASVMDTLIQVLEQEPVSPRHLNSAVDLDLETICLKCLEKDPTKRYLTANAVAVELQRYRNNEPILARPSSPIQKVMKWANREPSVAAWFLAIPVLVLASVEAAFLVGASVSGSLIMLRRQRVTAVSWIFFMLAAITFAAQFADGLEVDIDVFVAACLASSLIVAWFVAARVGAFREDLVLRCVGWCVIGSGTMLIIHFLIRSLREYGSPGIEFIRLNDFQTLPDLELKLLLLLLSPVGKAGICLLNISLGIVAGIIIGGCCTQLNRQFGHNDKSLRVFAFLFAVPLVIAAPIVFNTALENYNNSVQFPRYIVSTGLLCRDAIATSILLLLGGLSGVIVGLISNVLRTRFLRAE